MAYWQQHGGLSQFGYPLSNEFTDTSELNGKKYTMQYFERAVFELHPENKAPYDVLLAQLGTLRYRSQYPNGEPGGPYVGNLPIYPAAQNIRVDGTIEDGGGRKIMTFVTADRPELVLAFYKDVMQKTGWTVRVDPKYPNEMDFIYPTTPDEPLYALYLSITQAASGPTSVKLDLQVTFPR